MSAAATLPDQWFHSWDAHNTRKSPAPFSFPWGTHPSFCPTVWFSKPGTFYGITWKVSLCSLLVSIAKAHEECGNPYSVRFYSELHSESMSHHSITIPSNHNKLLGKFKVLLMKLEYSLKEMADGKCTSRCNRKTEQNKQKKPHLAMNYTETKYSWSRYKGIYKTEACIMSRLKWRNHQEYCLKALNLVSLFRNFKSWKLLLLERSAERYRVLFASRYENSQTGSKSLK